MDTTHVSTYLTKRNLIIVGALLLVLAGAFVFTQSNGNGVAPEIVEQPREVVLASVEELSREGTSRSVVGEVKAESEAQLEAKRGGQVTAVYVTEGAVVRAGTLLAETENAIERAAVAQASASRNGQRASLDRVLRGTRDEQVSLLQTGVRSAETEVAEARTALANTLAQTYTLAEDAIRNKADTVFRDPRTRSPRLLASTGQYSERVMLQQQRADFETMLESLESEVATLSSRRNLESYTNEIDQRLRTIRSFLDAIARLVSDQQPDSFNSQGDIEAQKAALFAARSSIDGALSALSQSRTRLTNAQSAVDRAGTQLEEGVSGALPEDINQARAALAQAEAGVQSAVAQLEQTRIRAPITGVLNSFTISRGDILSPGARVGVVVSDGTPLIEAFVSEQESALFTAGDRVLIEGGGTGEIISIAPGLDPITSRIRLRIAVIDSDRALVNGANVRITLIAEGGGEATMPERMTIPVTALRFGASQRSVYTVNDEGLLEEIVVVEGSVNGGRVEIVEGLSFDAFIVTDARGLRPGQLVDVAR